MNCNITSTFLHSPLSLAQESQLKSPQVVITDRSKDLSNSAVSQQSLLSFSKSALSRRSKYVRRSKLTKSQLFDSLSKSRLAEREAQEQQGEVDLLKELLEVLQKQSLNQQHTIAVAAFALANSAKDLTQQLEQLEEQSFFNA